MVLEKLDGCELPASADFHVHLRDGPMMHLVAPTIRQGGVNQVMVMPNLVPPITTVARALEYQSQLREIEPNVEFLMSLYLHPDITPETIREAKQAGVINVKSYPAGVTTHSSAGVVDYAQYYPVFEAMEKEGLILNLHGESRSGGSITVMNAEEAFLSTFLGLHKRFPQLRIILEHCTTKAAVEAVKTCGPTVAATITAHHLSITVDSWAGDPFNFCKPVAKLPSDREALLNAAVSGNPKFFLGTDSAPHPVTAKTGGADRKGQVAAGVFTQPYATQLVLDALAKGCEDGVINETDVTKEMLLNYLGGFGRRFYQVEDKKQEKIVLKKGAATIDDSLSAKDSDLEVIPFRRGQKTWGVEWK